MLLKLKTLCDTLIIQAFNYKVINISTVYKLVLKSVKSVNKELL